MEPGVQTPERTLAAARGSCRDSGWLLVQILRRLGLAARFVSGYLIQLRPDVGPRGRHRRAAEDFTDLHAWAEVYLPGAGWVGLDPTSGCLPVKATFRWLRRRAPSAAPITGAQANPRSTSVTMRIKRIHEDPRVTKPYSEEQWQAILTSGNRSTGTLLPAMCA